MKVAEEDFEVVENIVVMSPGFSGCEIVKGCSTTSHGAIYCFWWKFAVASEGLTSYYKLVTL